MDWQAGTIEFSGQIVNKTSFALIFSSGKLLVLVKAVRFKAYTYFSNVPIFSDCDGNKILL